jgi:hypothetical protein
MSFGSFFGMTALALGIRFDTSSSPLTFFAGAFRFFLPSFLTPPYIKRFFSSSYSI